MFEGFDYYQSKCSETAIFPEDLAIEYLTLGLLSEAGEVAGKIKKKIRKQNLNEDAGQKKNLFYFCVQFSWFLQNLKSLQTLTDVF